MERYLGMFKAKMLNNDHWVYGSYHKHYKRTLYPMGGDLYKKDDIEHLIIQDGSSDWGLIRGLNVIRVKKETVMAYSGFKNLYEGDIVDFYDKDSSKIRRTIVVKDEDYVFCLKPIHQEKTDEKWCLGKLKDVQYKVVGNTIDNPIDNFVYDNQLTDE